jgi:hypothetical protein
MTAEFSEPYRFKRSFDGAFHAYENPNYVLRDSAYQIDNSVKLMTDMVRRGESVDQEYIKHQKNLAANTLESVRGNEHIDWVEYYRLAITSDYMEERILAPIVFKDKNLYIERKELANGICGVAVERLGEALIDYNNANTSEELNQLYGICQELTVLAMMNRSQSPSMLAVPSSRFEDTRRKTDLQLYHMIKDRSYSIRVQVKSSIPEALIDTIRPTHGFVVVGADINNKRQVYTSQSRDERHSRDLLVSRALVKLHESHEPLTKQENKILESSQKKLDNIVREERYKIRGLRVK